MSVLTDILVFLAFVDIFQNNGHTIRSISRAAGAQLIVLLRADLRTLLAMIAPRVTDAAAARRFRHRRRDFEDALRSSGAVLVTREAKRLASIYNRVVNRNNSEINFLSLKSTVLRPNC